jgi:hypothetical protein
MTVCIGVTPHFTDRIILVSDQLLSSDQASVDGVLKVCTIAPGATWYVMYAGDPGRFLLLMERVRGELGDIRNTRLSVETVRAAFERAFKREYASAIETVVLGPYGLTLKEFKQKGKAMLGEVRLNRLADQIESFDLGVEVLVAGLDAWARTQLFSVSTRGVAMPAALPYHAIGSGASIALGALYALGAYPALDMPETVYRACAAKWAAESTRSVGETTYAVVLAPLSGGWTVLSEIDRLRDLWKRKGRPPFPSAARSIVSRQLRHLEARARKAAG